MHAVVRLVQAVIPRQARRGRADQQLVDHAIEEHTRALQDVLALLSARAGEPEARAAIRVTETLLTLVMIVQGGR